ncbi:hypothetical protein J6590_054390 [Homalodisca vitripennis]|nr:hypothetical protein J6590_054390 [Homalodisca vitripennis]
MFANRLGDSHSDGFDTFLTAPLAPTHLSHSFKYHDAARDKVTAADFVLVAQEALMYAMGIASLRRVPITFLRRMKQYFINTTSRYNGVYKGPDRTNGARLVPSCQQSLLEPAACWYPLAALLAVLIALVNSQPPLCQARDVTTAAATVRPASSALSRTFALPGNVRHRT